MQNDKKRYKKRLKHNDKKFFVNIQNKMKKSCIII